MLSRSITSLCLDSSDFWAKMGDWKHCSKISATKFLASTASPIVVAPGSLDGAGGSASSHFCKRGGRELRRRRKSELIAYACWYKARWLSEALR